MMIADRQYHNVRNWFEQCQHPLLVTHRRPDGDALGAMAALTLALRGLRLDAVPALFGPLPGRYALLADTVAWQRWDQDHDHLAEQCDALVILDTCSRSQLEPMAEYLPRAPRTLVIDHHPTRDDIATRGSDMQLIDEGAGAVCLLLAEWMKASRLPLNAQIATALLLGLGTDCGWFRFPNTDERMLRAAADLVAAGAPASRIYRAVYEQDSAARLRLIGRLLQGLELHAGGRLAVMKLREPDFAASGADRGIADDLVNEAGRLAGIEALLLFTEEPDGSVRVNFRSKEALDVSALAQRFGGGGHLRAAGARPQGKWDDVVSTVTAATVEALRR